MIRKGYAGSGIAMPALSDSTVSATIRQSDNAPIAREAATALVNRNEATGAVRPAKPAARGDRIMAGNPCIAGESPAEPVFHRTRGQYWGEVA